MQSKDWPNYGGRGIKICERWVSSFEAFLEDMGERPDGMMLERKDVNGNYEPRNCEWASVSVQAVNKRTTNLIEFLGEVRCLAEWARVLGLSEKSLRYRLAHWPLEKAMTQEFKCR